MLAYNENKENILPSLDFESLALSIRGHFDLLPDCRAGLNTKYKISDAALSAFSAFFMQCPSFLDHQRQMTQRKGRDNVQSLFKADAIPTDNHIRNLLDPISPDLLSPIFNNILKILDNKKYLNPYKSINDTFLLALDGTRYHSSKLINCGKCQHSHHDNGTITYSHSALIPSIVAPGNSNAICMQPEFIHLQDGDTKQDSEHKAAHRWLNKHSWQFKNYNITILGDDLFSHQPIIKDVLSNGYHFIFTCKPSSHITLNEHIDYLSKTSCIKIFSITRRIGRKKYIDTYRYINKIPKYLRKINLVFASYPN